MKKKIQWIWPPLLIIILAYYYGQRAITYRPPLPVLERNLPQTQGATTTLEYLKVWKILSPSHFVAKIFGQPCIFYLPHHNLQRGDFVSLKISLWKRGYHKVLLLKKHPLRFLKRFLGVLGSLFFFVFLYFSFYSPS